MTTKNTYLATSTAQRWHDFWHGEIGVWIITRGLRVIMLVIVV
ncbi:MAG TPA: mechanosensitive ion channel family protein, partial [Mycobacterium sp.]|nr:mechanosensitive ion channel family protein [Mycobacterium sp.]